MEICLKYLNLYIVNEIILSSNSINLNTNKRYIIAIYNSNILTKLLINYKSIKSCSTGYTFFYENYFYNLLINNDNIKTHILELAHDFNHTHLMDLLSTHYYKENTEDINNMNNIYVKINKHCCQISKYDDHDTKQLLKLSLNNYK